MSVMPDTWIKEQVEKNQMITNFVSGKKLKVKVFQKHFGYQTQA